MLNMIAILLVSLFFCSGQGGIDGDNSTLFPLGTPQRCHTRLGTKAFQDLQGKMVMTQQQMKLSDAQVETLKRSIQHSMLVEKELEKLPDTTRVYESVGRMFMISPIPEVKNTLEQKMKAAENKIKTIETNKGYLERSMKESEDSLRELIQTKQAKS